jgi:thiol:disulfide interchange protein
MKNIALFFALVFCSASFAQATQFEHVRVELRSKHSEIARGDTLTLAFVLQHEPEWHTYWQFPGDSGLPTRVKWNLDGALVPGEIEWPIPKPLEVSGIHNIGYDGETWLLLGIPIPATFDPSAKMIDMRAELSWLVCKQECIPGKGSFQIKVPLAVRTEIAHESRVDFMVAAQSLPMKAPASWQAQFALHDNEIRFVLSGDLAAAGIAADAVSTMFVGHDSLAAIAPTAVSVAAKQLSTRRAVHDSFTSMPESVDLLWVFSQGAQKTAVRTRAVKTAEISLAQGASKTTPSANSSNDVSLTVAIVFALLGGLILNVMPCVLPVLSLKIMSLIELGPAHVRSHAWLFSAGVLASFMLMAVVLIGLRASGQSLGWGFQMQSPTFIAVLSFTMLALALSMAGVVHFGASLGNLQVREDASSSGAFFSGVLAAIVASPCTAPLMGTALGFALSQPAWVIFLVLGALAIGFAFPMILLGIFPTKVRWLPKPGAWMQSLKVGLSVPLFLAAIWLLWVFGQQRGVDAMALLLVGAVFLSFALMIYEQSKFGDRMTPKLVAFGLLIFALIPAWQALKIDNPNIASTREQSKWAPYSSAALANLRASGKPVLVEMTAAWCITCKVNEKVAMSGPSFDAVVARHGVQLLKGDWTNQDSAITEFLHSFGASGVPLVVVYGTNGTNEILPQLLTPDLVANALARASQTIPTTE